MPKHCVSANEFALKALRCPEGQSPKDLPLGRWTDVTIADARRRKAEAVAAVASGDDPWHKRQEARSWELSEKIKVPPLPLAVELNLGSVVLKMLLSINADKHLQARQ